MLRTFPIEFIRQILEQKLFEEHSKDQNFFGGKEQIALSSFYEQLKSQDEVDRFVKTFRDLTDQQNRMGLIGNGIILSPENPSITNIYSSLIIPMSFTCNMRCTLANRDDMIWTINNLIEKLKGRKVDVAQLICQDEQGKKYAQPFCVGTIGQNDGKPALKDGDYLGDAIATSSQAKTKFNTLISSGVEIDKTKDYMLYISQSNKIKVAKCKYNGEGTQLVAGEELPSSIENEGGITTVVIACYMVGHYDSVPDLSSLHAIGNFTLKYSSHSYDCVNVLGTVVDGELSGSSLTLYAQFEVPTPPDFEPTYISGHGADIYYTQFNFDVVSDDGTFGDFVFPPEHTSFEKYKVSLSFDSIRCDEPRNLNAEEYCDLSFGGSATIVSNGVKLGNDLLKIKVSKNKIVGKTNITFIANNTYLEPLELPSGSNANTQINQLVSNKFKTNTHTDAIAVTLQYTFIMDKSIDLLNQWFDYARYGIQNLVLSSNVASINAITPNILYDLVEYWCSWGDFENKNVKAKIVENIDIENTESDTITLALSMQVQGDNN